MSGHFSKMLRQSQAPKHTDPEPLSPIPSSLPPLPGTIVKAPPSPTHEPDPELNPDFDTSNPRSLINLLPHFMRQRLDSINPDIFDLSEKELLEHIEHDNPNSATAHRLRMAFWDEYDSVQKHNEPQISVNRFIRGVCPLGYFQRVFVMNPYWLAWLLTPPEVYEFALRDIHTLSLRALRAAVALPIVDEKGRPNVKLIEAQNKIFQHVDMRLKGAIIQRVDQRNFNLNVDAKAEPEAAKQANQVAALTMEQINSQIQELEHKSKSLGVPGGVHVELMPAIIEADVVEKKG